MAAEPLGASGRLFALALLAATGACSSKQDLAIGVAASQPDAALGQAGYTVNRATSYNLRSADQISVVVFREPDLSLANVRIGVEGNVSLPMLGSIPAAGMTAEQFEQDVTRRFAAAGLRNPIVSVNIAQYASHLVAVEGAVDKPGMYEFQPGSRLSSAIALAGGTKRGANRREVAVFREGPEGIMLAKFDYAMISQGKMLDPVLEPGDRVVMGTNGLSLFWQDLITALPAFGVFAAVAAQSQ